MAAKKKNEEPQAAKKTRELPNLSECHSCHWRIDIANANAKTKLLILYSEWRIVLLCKRCFSRVESSELCSYCFAASSSQASFTCRQCNRRVHRDCDSEYRSAVILSPDSCLAMEFPVCADCWVPESLSKWRGAVNSSKARRTGKRLGLGKGRVSAMVDDSEIEIDDALGGEEGSKSSTDDEDDDFDADIDADDGHLTAMNGPAQKYCSQNVSVGVCDSSTDVSRQKLDIEEDNGDKDGLLKEGEGSCSNGVDLGSPEECGVTTPEDERFNRKLDPFYFKYRKRSTADQSLLTYKRKKSNADQSLSTCKREMSNADQSLLTYKRKKSNGKREKSNADQSLLTYKRRRPENLNGFACYMFTYKRRPKPIYPCFMLTYKKRRPRILYAR